MRTYRRLPPASLSSRTAPRDEFWDEAEIPPGVIIPPMPANPAGKKTARYPKHTFDGEKWIKVEVGPREHDCERPNEGWLLLFPDDTPACCMFCGWRSPDAQD